MTQTDIHFLNVLTEFVASGWSWGAIGMLIAISIAWRIVRGDNFKAILGISNGYLKEKEYREDMKDLKTLIKSHAENEKARMDKHAKEIEGIRDKLQEVDGRLIETSTKVEAVMDQYRSK